MEYQDQVLSIAQIVASNQPNQTLSYQRQSAGTNRSGARPTSQRIRIKTQEQAISFQENSNSYTYQRQNSQRQQQQIGPGAYEIQNPAHLQQNCPQISFTKGSRSDRKHFTNPGPGQYNILSERQSKTFVFNSRNSISFEQRIPGPGTYNLSQTSQRSISFGTARKMFYERFETPGPGQYDIDKKVQKKKIDRIERLLKPKLMVRSYYNRDEDKVLQEILKQRESEQKSKRPKSAIQLKQEVRRKKMEKLRKSSKINPPGPGAYEIKDFIKIDKVDQKGMTKQKVIQSERPNMNEQLGPGTYNVKDFLSQIEYVKKGNQKSVFGKSRRFQKDVISDLGPGYYEIIDEQY